MWVERLTLKNVKCFEDCLILLTHEGKTGTKARPHKWVTLLGENGTGKTTVLQALALLLAGPEAVQELLPRPVGWHHRPFSECLVGITIHQDDKDTGKGIFPAGMRFKGSFYYTLSSYTVLSESPLGDQFQEGVWRPMANMEPSGNAKGGWFAAGYGAFRRLDRQAGGRVPLPVPPQTRANNFQTQFVEEYSLSLFEQWMLNLDYRSLKEKDKSSAQQLETAKQVISKLLPGNVKISGISSNGQILFDLGGATVPTIGLSDGYRSMIALAGDLIWRLMSSFPEMEDPTQAYGVVLIDELDIHLHPQWQREIPGWLRQTFPNLQFIVATHSPLVAIGAGSDALTLHFEAEEGGVTVNRLSDLSYLDFDRALRSPAFGLSSTRSPQAQEKIEDYRKMQSKKGHLTAEQKKEFEQLELFAKKALAAEPEPDSLEARLTAYLERKLS